MDRPTFRRRHSATQLGVLSRLTPLNDLRSDALFLFPRLPACVLWPARLCDFVLTLLTSSAVRNGSPAPCPKVPSGSIAFCTSVACSSALVSRRTILCDARKTPLAAAVSSRLQESYRDRRVLTPARKHLIATFDFLNHYDLPLDNRSKFAQLPSCAP